MGFKFVCNIKGANRSDESPKVETWVDPDNDKHFAKVYEKTSWWLGDDVTNAKVLLTKYILGRTDCHIWLG